MLVQFQLLVHQQFLSNLHVLVLVDNLGVFLLQVQGPLLLILLQLEALYLLFLLR